MVKPVREHFVSGSQVTVSPVLANLLQTPQFPQSVQPNIIRRGLDEMPGWQQVGTNKSTSCYTLENPVNKTLNGCYDLCMNGDKQNPGYRGCNAINYQHATPTDEALCSTHICKDVNNIPLTSNPGTDVWAWLGGSSLTGKQPTENIWVQEHKGRRADCLPLNHDKGIRVDDVSGCIRECTINDECNVFNYDTDASPSCFLQSCPNLPNIPLMEDKFPNSSVWYKSGGTPTRPPLGPGGEERPRPSPGPGPSPGPDKNIWVEIEKNKRATCRPLRNGNFNEMDVSGCIRRCTVNGNCNVFNYDEDAEYSCMLQDCNDTNNIPYDSHQFQGASVWKRMGGGPTRPTLGPGGEQKQPQGPGDNCPDMSQYIRLDEIPCWNCTLP